MDGLTARRPQLWCRGADRSICGAVANTAKAPVSSVHKPQTIKDCRLSLRAGVREVCSGGPNCFRNHGWAKLIRTSCWVDRKANSRFKVLAARLVALMGSRATHVVAAWPSLAASPTKGRGLSVVALDTPKYRGHRNCGDDKGSNCSCVRGPC